MGCGQSKSVVVANTSPSQAETHQGETLITSNNPSKNMGNDVGEGADGRGGDINVVKNVDQQREGPIGEESSRGYSDPKVGDENHNVTSEGTKDDVVPSQQPGGNEAAGNETVQAMVSREALSDVEEQREQQVEKKEDTEQAEKAEAKPDDVVKPEASEDIAAPTAAVAAAEVAKSEPTAEESTEVGKDKGEDKEMVDGSMVTPTSPEVKDNVDQSTETGNEAPSDKTTVDDDAAASGEKPEATTNTEPDMTTTNHDDPASTNPEEKATSTGEDTTTGNEATTSPVDAAPNTHENTTTGPEETTTTAEDTTTAQE